MGKFRGRNLPRPETVKPILSMADMKPCMASVHVDFLLHVMHDPQYIEKNLVWVIRNVAAPYLRVTNFNAELLFKIGHCIGAVVTQISLIQT
jgi:hypothetical protein